MEAVALDVDRGCIVLEGEVGAGVMEEKKPKICILSLLCNNSIEL
jgi:hypothetical protein